MTALEGFRRFEEIRRTGEFKLIPEVIDGRELGYI
jgi:hypothetical protein